MKIELVEEIKPATGTMFHIRVDNEVIKWFTTKEYAEAYYNEIITNPNLLKPVINILKSQEIEVSLEK